MSELAFIKNVYSNNHILKEEGNSTYVSWLPPKSSPALGIESFAMDDLDTGETAYWNGSNFLILNGDHRDKYLEFYPDVEKCTEYFYNNIDQASSWSEHNLNRPNRFM